MAAPDNDKHLSLDENSLTPTTHSFDKHPMYQHMLYISQNNKKHTELAILVYLDVTESKNWWNVKVYYCQPLTSLLIEGHPSVHDEKQLILPIEKSVSTTIEKMRCWIKEVKTMHLCSSLTLGLVDTDSTIVYYKITDGLVPPEPPEITEYNKERRQFRFQKKRSRFHQLSSHGGDGLYAEQKKKLKQDLCCNVNDAGQGDKELNDYANKSDKHTTHVDKIDFCMETKTVNVKDKSIEKTLSDSEEDFRDEL